ncbi:biopolymer transporter ExbD [Maricaulis maris]|jgi:biopolymer transport protein ExbD|uniref:ExbD/TolR family protein n=1 Tax=Maricaulis maris TaxID=74318 RepID=UPI0026F36DD9|nr:biopolymer transporter ExbD [Maricaulis maris]
MRKRFRKRDDQAEVNMTPMLDIVFILLIFFIVTATFLSEEGVDLRPPPECEGAGCEAPNRPVILIQVDSDNQVFVNQDRTDIERVLASVNRHRAENPESSVLLEVHDESDHGVVVRIWDDMGANGVPVSIQRTEEDGRGM